MRIAAARPDSAPDGDDGTYGPVRDPKVKLQISPNIENGAMSHINSIIVPDRKRHGQACAGLVSGLGPRVPIS